MIDENKAWMKFFVSGKVDDYLRYCDSKQIPPEVSEDEHQDKGNSPQPQEFSLPGEVPYTTNGQPWLN